MKYKFVAMGECMVEMAPTADGTYVMGFAGDTLNTAWYARKLFPESWTVSYLTTVGTDGVSNSMVQFIEAAGLDTGIIGRRDDKTVGLYVIQLSNGERSFAYWRSDSAAKTLASDADDFQAKLDGAKVVYFSGITLAILAEPDRVTFLEGIAKARAAGSTIVLDPNLRLRLWSNVDEMREVITKASQHSDIILPSYEDEVTFFNDGSQEETARRYGGAGAGLVVVKNGPGDVVCLRDGVLSSYSSIPVENVLDTTAAGDSFNAGFLAAYLDDGDLKKAVDAGNRLACRVIGQRGALVDVLEPA
ncbi:sugar kinase [Roseibium algae]|uniref:Sugar kinase n=1 Tax=Roseibium algae TaxID=3123038 RepID=A0ABU8TGY4_9HYPH